MPLLARMEKHSASIQPWSMWTLHLIIVVCVLFVSCVADMPLSLAAEPWFVQQSRVSSPFVGSAMAVLATLEQAQVLPPEGTKDADRVIKSVIQLQSAFTKSTDSSIQTFLLQAIQSRHGVSAPALVEQFRSTGWTSEVMEALADAERQSSREDLRTLTPGLGHFNLSVEDFTRFMQLVRDGQTALVSRGQNFPDAYAFHRKAMPGHQIEKQ